MRVVVDTNVVVSAAISPTGLPARVLRLWRENRFELLVSSMILDEYREVLSFDRVQKHHGLSPEEIRETVAEFARFGSLILPMTTLRIVEADPDDDMFFECAVAGSASIIISGDPHLQNVESYQGIRVLSPAEFLQFLAAQPPPDDRDSISGR